MIMSYSKSNSQSYTDNTHTVLYEFENILKMKNQIFEIYKKLNFVTIIDYE